MTMQISKPVGHSGTHKSRQGSSGGWRKSFSFGSTQQERDNWNKIFGKDKDKDKET